jgi:DNA-binding NtrC family response regulator
MAHQTRIVGTSTFARRIGKMLSKLAAGKEDILLVGESGTGRRTIAWEIHGARGKKRPYILVNGRSVVDEEFRATITGQHIENAEELIGRKPATLQDNATLCVADADLLGSHNLDILNRFMKDGRKKFSGIKMILTMSDSPEGLLQDNRITPDIATLLQKFERVDVPPIRERLEDIPFLAESIVANICENAGLSSKSIDANNSHILSQGQWPGNIHQLADVLGKAVLISRGDKLELPPEFLDEHQHLEDAIRNIMSGTPFILDKSLYLIEKLVIQRALKHFLYNQSKTAQIFGLSEANFRYRLKKFGLPSIRRKA